MVYEHVIKELGCLPSEILFVDDALSAVEAAAEVELKAYHYKSLAPFQKYLRDMVER